MIRKIVAILFIFCCTSVSWIFLGSVMKVRTTTQDAKLKSVVGKLWGAPQVQKAPQFFYQIKNPQTNPPNPFVVPNSNPPAQIQFKENQLPINSSDVNVLLNLDYRQKGLLWYSTYRIRFTGRYTFQNPVEEPCEIFVRFQLPSKDAVYDNFRLSVANKPVSNVEIQSGTVQKSFLIPPGKTETLEITYGSQGMDEWWYDFGSEVTQVNNFLLNLKTDFDEINFPENSISPTSKTESGDGWNLKWQYGHLLSGTRVGMELPHKLNPGPWVSSVTYAAPISLFLFFFLLLILSTLNKVNLHPMHYFFIGASFFSFHILLAYLVDHISIHTSFIISSLVSIALVISYVRVVAGKRFAFVEAGIAQFVYLVLFSYTFFFEEYTGLAVTVLAILTLFAVMQITARVDWQSVFARNSIDSTSSGLRCPYCRAAIEGSTTRRCGNCGTEHHQRCWSDHGRCAIFGCASNAPPVMDTLR